MDIATIKARKKRVTEQFGPWTAHNIRLARGLYTIRKDGFVDEFKQRRILQFVADVVAVPFAELRVLDLGCGEGAYAVEFAVQGAQVIGIEGREANFAKACLAKEALDLDNLALRHEDVRALDVAVHGRFDVVLCLGLLFHFDAADLFPFVEKIAAVTERVAIFDTHIATGETKQAEHNGATYYGRKHREHPPGSTATERLRNPWASLDNEESFWLTRPSLLNLLAHVGFTTVYECHIPAENLRPRDRITLVAIKGTRQAVHTAPRVNAVPDDCCPETYGRSDSPTNGTTQYAYVAPLPPSVRSTVVGAFRRIKRAWEATAE